MTRLRSLRLLRLMLPLLAPRHAPAPLATVQGAFFAISVADLEASTRWYTEKLGLTVASRFPATATASGLLLAGGGLEVELIARTGAAPKANRVDSADAVPDIGLFKVGVRVADFDRTIEELRRRGVPIVIGPFPPRKDQRANAIIRDNAGNLIQFFGDYAR